MEPGCLQCKAEYLLSCGCDVGPQAESRGTARQAEGASGGGVSLSHGGSFTYFTTCIEGGVGRVNDSVALHGGDVGLDNLQLRTTTVTDNRQNNTVVNSKVSDVRRHTAGGEGRGKKTR